MLTNRLSQFLASIDPDAIFSRLDPELEIEPDWLSDTLNTYANEARVGLDLVLQSLSKDIRVLEVGSGLCLLSIFLKLEGYDITALEPSTGGFDHFDGIRRAISAAYNTNDLIVLDKTAQQLSVEADGEFDLIYSNNVLEHIPDLENAVEGMKNVLAPNGRMLHTCPNYHVPYEPHFGIPVIGICPSLTVRLFKSRIRANHELWNSLNFVTQTRIKRLVRSQGLKVVFDKNVMYDAFMRLENDPTFADRHQHTMVGKIFRILKTSHLLSLIKLIPPSASTPMRFTITKKVVR